MADFVQTVEQDVKALEAEVVNEAKALGAEGLTLARALFAGIRQGQFAIPLTQVASLLKDAQTAETALIKDINAVVPQNVKDFLASKGTLDSLIAVPFTGKTLLNIHFIGTKEEFIAAVAAGMPL